MWCLLTAASGPSQNSGPMGLPPKRRNTKSPINLAPLTGILNTPLQQPSLFESRGKSRHKINLKPSLYIGCFILIKHHHHSCQIPRQNAQTSSRSPEANYNWLRCGHKVTKPQTCTAQSPRRPSRWPKSCLV